MALKSKSNSIKYKHRNNLGFTIVELLVVIVVIAILAAIVIVSYMGISKKATEAGLQSDLKGAKTQLELYKVEHGTYPTAMDANNCPTTPTPDTNYCLNKSIVYTPVGGNGLSYDLVITKNNSTFETTDTTPPFIINPITGIAAITGNLANGQTLTAGALTPAGATASYQWQSSTTSNGTYANIPGATSSTYAISPATIGKYLKVVATGTGAYTGTQTSAASSQVAADANWLTIGTQTWAKANLNAGAMVTNSVTQTNNAVVEKYCYGNSEANCTIDGGLYQWDEAMQYVTASGAQGICPAGSHIPSDNDWKILETQLGMTQLQADATGTRGTDQGAQLKSGGSSGLNIPLAGDRDPDTIFYNRLASGFVWSSGAVAGVRYFGSGYASIGRDPATNKSYGFSVRCLAN